MYLYQVVFNQFALVRAEDTAAAALQRLRRSRQMPPAALVREGSAARVKYYLYFTDDLWARVQGVPAAPLTEALDLPRETPLPVCDAYTPEADAPALCVVAQGQALLGIYARDLNLFKTRYGVLGHGEAGLAPRYLNAGFFERDQAQPVPADTALAVSGGPYRLGVNVGEFWGPGLPTAPFPDDELAAFYRHQGVLELDVAVHAAAAQVDPVLSKLLVPQTGDSDFAFFRVVFAEPGRQVFDVDLSFRGHLLQSRRLEVQVTQKPGDPLLPAEPAQRGYLTANRTADLGWRTLGPLGETPRRLTIVARRGQGPDNIALHIYTREGARLAEVETRLNDQNLKTAMDRARLALRHIMGLYQGKAQPTDTDLQAALCPLAVAGHSLYHNLLPQAARSVLRPGDIIQAAPLSVQLGVPWEVLYERPVETYRPGRSRLCASFRDHGPRPEDCPSHDDASVVCPHGFWGYRYVVEQLPLRCDASDEPPLSRLALTIGQQPPLRLSLVANTALALAPRLQQRLQRLASSSGLVIRFPIDTLPELMKILGTPDHAPDIVYFYVHGLITDGLPCLSLSPVLTLQPNDLDAWIKNFTVRHPLVVLNACESAAYGPDAFENFIDLFCEKGAAGVIGTQTDITERLAQDVIQGFFEAFFQQVPAGQALFNVRQRMLRDQSDPRALAYSLFASADVSLARPILRGQN